MLAPFTPERLPLRSIRCAPLKNAFRQALLALQRLETVLHPRPSSKLISVLLATESLSALESQGIYLSSAAFLRLQMNRRYRSKNERQLLYYYVALKSGIRAISTQSITKELLCMLHARIKRGFKKAKAGKYRTKQNWIGRAHCTKEKAVFLPPSVPVMQRAMRNWLIYCNRKTKEPLIHIAIAIAQLLIIHPFMDGNGRVARILATLLLYKQGLLSQPLLFLSPYFQKQRKTYIRRLYEITEKGKWEEWILFFLKGVRQQADQAYRIAKKNKKP